MGVTFNNLGFVRAEPDGTLIQDSRKSAQSGKWVVPTGVLVAVPDTPGLFYRLTHGESTKLSKVQHKALQQKATDWLASMTGEPESKPKGRRSGPKARSEPDSVGAPGGDASPGGDEPSGENE